MSEQPLVNIGFQSLFDKLDAEHDRHSAAAKKIREDEAVAAERWRIRCDELARIIINALATPPHYWGPAVPKTYDLEPVLHTRLDFHALRHGTEIASHWNQWRHHDDLCERLKALLPPRVIVVKQQSGDRDGITFHLLMSKTKKD